MKGVERVLGTVSTLESNEAFDSLVGMYDTEMKTMKLTNLSNYSIFPDDIIFRPRTTS
jgi:hypothetical protein